MTGLFLYKLGAILIFASLILGSNANENVGLDLSIFADPDASKMVGKMLANPIFDAIKAKNPESPMLEFPFGELIGAGINLIGGAITGGTSRRRTTTPKPRNEDFYGTRREPQQSIPTNMNSNGISGHPPYTNGYLDQFGVFRPFSPVYNGPYGNNQPGPPFYPQYINPNAQGNTNNYPPQQLQYYPIYNDPRIGATVPVANPVTATPNLDDRRSSHDMENILNNFPANKGNLPDNHDFASPVDVDTLGRGRPVPPFNSSQPQAGPSVDHQQIPLSSAPTPTQSSLQSPNMVGSQNGPTTSNSEDRISSVDVPTLRQGTPVPPLYSPKPQASPSIVRDQSGPVNTPQMPNNYPAPTGFYDPFGNFRPFQPYSYGYYDQFGVFRQLPAVHNGHHANNQPGPPVHRTPFVPPIGPVAAPVPVEPTPNSNQDNPNVPVTRNRPTFVRSNPQGPCLPDHFDFSQAADIEARCGKLRLVKPIQY